MDRDAIRAEVQEILRDVLEDDAIVVTDATVAEDVADWDSTNHVRVMVAIERQYSIRFETDEISKAESVGELVDLIKAKLDG